MGRRKHAHDYQNLEYPLRNCETLLSELVAKVVFHFGQQSDGKRNGMGFANLKWSLATKHRIGDLRSRLEAAKSTLNSALSAITTYVVVLTTFISSNNIKNEDYTQLGYSAFSYSARIRVFSSRRPIPSSSNCRLLCLSSKACLQVLTVIQTWHRTRLQIWVGQSICPQIF